MHLQQVASLGDNPSGIKMYIYVPTDLAAKSAIVVTINFCMGIAQAYYSGTPYILLLPSLHLLTLL
jgi:acetylxylan esterase